MRDTSEALNENVFPASLVCPGHGSTAALKEQTTFMNPTAFNGQSAGSVEERFGMSTNQNKNASGDPT